MSDMPKSVRIGHRTYKIEHFVPADDLIERLPMGVHSYEKATIKVEDSADAVRMSEVLLHEILHGFWAVGELPDEHEEHMVTILARQMVQSLQDNPKVWGWITKNARATNA